MKKIDLGRTIGMFANLGVIAGIVFLAVEVRQNNDLLRSEAEYRFFDNRRLTGYDVYRDPILADLLLKLQSGDELTDNERLRGDFYYQTAYQNWRWEYSQWKEGRIEQLPLAGWRKFATSTEMSRHVLEDWIRSMREIGGSDAEYAEYLERDVLQQ